MRTAIRLFRQRLGGHAAAPLVVVLFLFMVCRLLSLEVFFEGFLKVFPRIDAFLFGRSTLLSWVPYHQFSIVFAALLHPLFLLALILLYVPFFLKRHALLLPSFRFSIPERLIIFACAALLAWELTGYDYNYYLDRPFYTDRAVLIILALLLLRFPLLTPLFVAFAYVYRSQFNYPVDGFPLYDKRLLFDLLILFTVHVYARLYLPRFKTSFLFLALCVLASGYFAGGFIKILISPHGYEWLWNNDPADLFYNSCHRGWMASCSEDTVQTLGNFFSRYGKPFQTLAFIIELSALFLLHSRRAGIVILCALLAMHSGIFILAGILFWKWMAIDLLLLFFYFYKSGIWINDLFRPHTYRSSLVVICLCFAWLQPIPFGWHDTPANQYFTYEVEDEAGNVYALGKNEMNPYHQWFQIDRFLFLVNKPCLPLTGFGYTYKYSVAKAIKKAGAAHYAEVELEKGKQYFQLMQKQAYERFIQTYFRNRNNRLNTRFFPSAWMAPLHLYNSEKGQVWKGQVPVKIFRVTLNRVYTLHGKPVWLSRDVVDEITIKP